MIETLEQPKPAAFCSPEQERLTADDAVLDAPVLKIAVTDAEIRAYFKIRHQVFVEEQAIFEKTDRDAHDDDAIPILACFQGRAIGAVRCYPKTKKTWYGGRLAVDKDFRTYNIGALLVYKAVETMNARPDIHRFLATVQRQNVRFFRRLAWIRRGRLFLLKGKEHQMMEKVLDRNKR